MQNNRRHFSRICDVLACAIALLAGCVRPYDAQIFLTYSDNTQSFLRISVPWSIRADRSPSYSEQYGTNGTFVSTAPFSEIVAVLQAENPDVTFQNILEDRYLLTDTAGSRCMLKVEQIVETAASGEEASETVFPNGLTAGTCETDGRKYVRLYQLKCCCYGDGGGENFPFPLHLLTAEETGLMQHIAFSSIQPRTMYLTVGTSEDFQSFYKTFGLQPEPTGTGFRVQCTGSGGSQMLVTFTFGTAENSAGTVLYEVQKVK